MYKDQIKAIFYTLLGIFLLLFVPSSITAHEQWFLTSHQMGDLMAQPRPALFSQFNVTNVCILLFVFITIYTLLVWERRAAREFFPEHQLSLASKSHLASFFLRIATAAMLILAVFGLNPRLGAEHLHIPTLIFPDLQLNLVSQSWHWIQWIEIAIAIGLLLGIYVRLQAILLLSLGILGLFLFKIKMLCYFGFVAGIALYLLYQGAGMWFVSLPQLPGTKKITGWLQAQAPYQAPFTLRVLTGLDFALTGFICKFIYPTVAIGLLSMQHMPTFGLHIETVVFWMAIIETFAGLLLMFGVLTRPLSFVLMGCFIFLAYAINESLYSHVIFFGVLMACYINGNGQKRPRVAKDKPAHIVILGASLSGIYCAMHLDHLKGKNSNVKVTVINHENYFQFGPLLSDVISGLVQPINITNPIRNICPNHRVIQGRVTRIFPDKQQLKIALISKEDLILSYDQLVITHETLEYLNIPGLKENAIPIFSISDALFVRKHVLSCLEKAELISSKEHRKQLLTFSIIGKGLRASSVATEIQALIKSALVFYPSLSFDEIKIFLFHQEKEGLPTFDSKLVNIMHKNLIKMGIHIEENVNIEKITAKTLSLSTQKEIRCNTIINAATNITTLLPIDKRLNLQGYKNIFSASMSAYVTNEIPFQTLYEIKLGQLAAYNVWASSQGLSLKEWKIKNNFFYVACLGRYASIAKIGTLTLTGLPAWIISRFVCIFTLPGLEKNIRVLADWTLNIPFRRNICVFPANLSTQSPYKMNVQPLLVIGEKEPRTKNE